jgi:nucleoside-diphosphate-sugar epimerase
MLYNVLVTGGAGYIGSLFVEKLLEWGYNVHVLDNLYYDNQASLNHLMHYSNLHVHQGDVRKSHDIDPLLSKVDIIFPLAALVGAPVCSRDPISASSTNKDAIFYMLDKVSKNQLVIMPTTNSAYGSGDKDNFCTEESPLNPISLYAKDKVEVEKRLMDHQNSISFRLATVFGMSPRMRIDLLVNDFTHRAVHDGFVILFESHFKRNYIHVRDVCKAFIHGINNFDIMNGQIYNVGLSDANISKLELCQRIQKYLPNFTFVEAPLQKDPDQRNYIVSNAKIEATGFKPDFSLDRGIIELIKGYQLVRNTRYGNM